MVTKNYKYLKPIPQYGQQYTPRPFRYVKTITKDNLAREMAKSIIDGMRKSPYMPYRTGNLKANGIKFTASKNKATIIIGNRQVPYAYFLEYSNKTVYGNPNRHKGWVEKTIYGDGLDYALSYLRMKDSTLSPKIKSIQR